MTYSRTYTLENGGVATLLARQPDKGLAFATLQVAPNIEEKMCWDITFDISNPDGTPITTPEALEAALEKIDDTWMRIVATPIDAQIRAEVAAMSPMQRATLVAQAFLRP